MEMAMVSAGGYLQPLVHAMKAWRNLGPSMLKFFLHLSSTSWGQAGFSVAV